ncbi:DUF5949 family protein [Streptomyces sp. TLI_185]|uniref:DUF5949 family protein n=1 Tax=Streptomyces sp. TLI_185 TaxID=2485151 RepID=UPI000F50C0DE|nr:DUF5949 family protein [Streptomyces sp. TLI_185]RPF33633.1 hypothetical protein EDD92_3555 [Streptomyces sp. TLI_185]
MTSTPTEARSFRMTDLGTLVLLPWSGAAADGGDLPYLLAYSLGDADGGPQTTSAAVEGLLAGNGLRVGGGLVDATAGAGIAVSLFVEAGQAFVTMPQLGARCAAPPEWLAAVAERGYAYLVFTTRPWPEGRPGRPIEPAALAAFAGAEQTLRAAAHVLLPALTPR